jgi:hypothetical protein
MTCGECAWCWRDEDDYYGDCTAPLPMWVMSDEYNSIHDLLDASSCPCFKARVCQRCGGTGKDDSVADRLSSDPIKPKGTPCPACRKEGR